MGANAPCAQTRPTETSDMAITTRVAARKIADDDRIAAEEQVRDLQTNVDYAFTTPWSLATGSRTVPNLLMTTVRTSPHLNCSTTTGV